LSLRNHANLHLTRLEYRMKHHYGFSVGTLFCSLMICSAVLSAQEVRLAYKFKVGDVSRYKETTQNDMNSDMMPAGGQKVFNEMYTTQKVDKVNTDGSADVIQTVDSVNTLLNGQPFSNPQTMVLVGLPVRVTVAANGKVLDARPVSDTADATVVQAVDILRKQLMTQACYPETAVAVNNLWWDSATYSQSTQMGTITSTIRYSTKLAGSDRVLDTDVRVLERTMDVSGELGNGTGTLKGNGKGNVYFSDTLGKEIMSTMAIEQTMDMVTPQGPFNMSMKISTRRELLK
jgi:hypothetical protein